MRRLAVSSRRVLRCNGDLEPATVIIEDGIIVSILPLSDDTCQLDAEVIDAGDDVVMAGLVDSHVHINEPGRTSWEGFSTATRAAAAGGFTTIVDMPLNSIPPTVSVEALKVKRQAAQGQCHVDVAFWGGVIPHNEGELRPMIDEGVCGFKCFMIDSGVDEFPCVSVEDIRLALDTLKGTNSVLLFHAETAQQSSSPVRGQGHAYTDFLCSRPDVMEVEAISTVASLCSEFGVRCHIVHLSSAEALPVIRQAKTGGAPLTVETTHHYLCLAADTVPSGATQYKCCPPIRNKTNQEVLWQALTAGDIDLVVSDHSPCTADLKLLDQGDFMKAWGGIASLQFGLSLFWTEGSKRGFSLADVTRLLSNQPAKLAGIDKRKGALDVGFDGDLVIWSPEAEYVVTEDLIHHKNKVTPYLNIVLKGVVTTTILRGHVVYKKGAFASQPMGTFVQPK